MLEMINLYEAVFLPYIEQFFNIIMTKICANHSFLSKGHYFEILISSMKMINFE